MSNIVKVNVSWGKKKLTDIELDLNDSPLVFKAQLYALTGVPPEKQKVMVKGGLMKDDTDLNALAIKPGQNLMLMGTAEAAVVAPTAAVVFEEDLSRDQVAQLQARYPAGLANLGNTCYLNSAIQVLKQIPQLEENLRGVPRQSGIYQLAGELGRLIGELHNSKTPVVPFNFLTLFRNVFPQFDQIQNGHQMQQDADEAVTSLLTAAETANPAVRGLFEGSTRVTWTNAEDPKESVVVNEPFLKLACHIGAHTNFLEDGLRESFAQDGERRSASLGRDAVFKKATVITVLPEYVIVHFVRFFWKKDTKQKAKILRAVEFPFTLDLFDFCDAELKQTLGKQRDLRQQRKDEPTPAKDETGDAVMRDPIGPTGLYELLGVVTHQGRSADGGHYIAWLKESENSWLKFDDAEVSPVTPDKVKELSGKGGGDWHIAYMNVYRRLQE